MLSSSCCYRDEPPPNKFYGTLPKSFTTKNVVTAVKENEDPEVLEKRKEMVQEFSPAELAQFSSIADFPVPSRIANIFTGERKKKQAARRR